MPITLRIAPSQPIPHVVLCMGKEKIFEPDCVFEGVKEEQWAKDSATHSPNLYTVVTSEISDAELAQYKVNDQLADLKFDELVKRLNPAQKNQVKDFIHDLLAPPKKVVKTEKAKADKD